MISTGHKTDMGTATSCCPAPASGQLLGAREAQEDATATYYREAGNCGGQGEYILVLADGMGGHVGGAAASSLAVSVFIESFLQNDADIRRALNDALETANTRLADKIEEVPELFDMGTTLTGAVICDQHLYWISVGDSPLWLYRNGSLTRVNADHSMVPVLEGLVEIGRMSEEEAANDVRRNHLRSAVSGGELTLVDLCPEPVRLTEGDWVILASDGVETLTDLQLSTLIETSLNATPDQLSQAILQAVAAVERPEQDNASLILFRYFDSEHHEAMHQK